MHRRSRRLGVLGALLGRGRPHSLLAAQPMHPALADQVAGGHELVGDEPVAELGIVGVDVDDGVGEVGVGPVPVRARLGAPLVEGLRREAEDPARQPHRDSVGGQVTDEREHHFGSESLAK